MAYIWIFFESWSDDIIDQTYANLSESQKHNFTDVSRIELKSYLHHKYRQKKMWKYAAMSFLGGYIVIFVVGHGGFCLVVWVIRFFQTGADR